MNLFAEQKQMQRIDWTQGWGEDGMDQIEIDMYTLPCVKQIASGTRLYSAESLAWCSVVTQLGEMQSWKEGQDVENICIRIAGSLCFIPETKIL